MKTTNLFVAAGICAISMLAGCGSDTSTTSTPPGAPSPAGPSAVATPAAPAGTAATAPDAATPAAPAATAVSPSDGAMVAGALTDQAQKLLDQAAQYIKDNKLDLADKAVGQLEEMKPKLPADWASKIDALKAAVTTAKAGGGLSIPKL